MAWGNNTYGQTNVPAGLANVSAIRCGWMHSLAIQSNGTIIAWGDNTYGQTNVPANLTNACLIAAGSAHNLSSTTNGGFAAWGNNYFGQTNFPPGLTNVTTVAAGGYHSLALAALTIPPLVFNTTPPNLQLASGGVPLRVDGSAGLTPVVICASTDLVNWTTIFTNPPVVGSVQFLDSSATNFPLRFYRAREN